MAARIEWLLASTVAIMAPSAWAVDYFTVDQVQKALFPGASEFRSVPVQLTNEQMKAIGKASDTGVRSPKVNVWKAFSGSDLLGFVVVDQVYGKHEFISYAVAISTEGAVQSVEVMNYNESYGGEIRDAAWRGQFSGKKAGDAVKINSDIRNIGGATLSCVHITDGIRRVLATFDIAIKGAA